MWMTAETWMTADEALARGLTDEVSKSDPIEPEAKPEPRKAAFNPIRIAVQMKRALDDIRRDAIVERAASRASQTGPAPRK
jgi:enoyl-CoA hydratase/carnithine racemase